DEAETFLQIHSSSPGDYRGSLKLRSLDLRALAGSISPKSSEVRGRADLTLDFARGEGQGASAVIAQGSLAVTEGSLIDVPFVSAILKAVAPPVAPTFSRADAQFRLRRSKIVVDRLDFWGAPISLDGSGSLDLDG